LWRRLVGNLCIVKRSERWIIRRNFVDKCNEEENNVECSNNRYTQTPLPLTSYCAALQAKILQPNRINLYNQTPQHLKMKYTIRPVTASDAPALAAVLMSAWQSDPHWAAGWNYATLEQMTAWSSERTPYQLISDRATKRHQMAVSTETGEIVGYARWELPPSLASQDAWLEARVADVGEEEREGYKRRFEGVDEKEGMPSRKGNEEMFEYRGRELEVAMKRMEEEGPFLSLFFLCFFLYIDKSF
jgi:hypothetical protein